MRHALSWMAMGAAVLSCTGSMDLGTGSDEGELPAVPDLWTGSAGKAPTAVTATQELPYDLAARDGRVFWTADLIGWNHPSAAVEGCTPESCAASLTTYESGPLQINTGSNEDRELRRPRAVSVDDTTVYWAHDGLLFCPIAGCSGEPEVFDTSGNLPTEIAVDADDVYWTSTENSGVFKCAKTGCHGAPQVIALNQPSPFQIALDETAVYWIRDGGYGSYELNVVPRQAVLMRAEKDGTALEEICGDIIYPVGLAVNATHVYWSVHDDSQILRCPKAGCVGSPELVASSPEVGGAILLDDDWVYWYTAGRGLESILRCPLDGCGSALTVLAAKATTHRYGELSPRALAQDSDYLYWRDGSPSTSGVQVYGAIWRMHK